MTNNKKWFMAIAVFALIWNVLGVMAYLMVYNFFLSNTIDVYGPGAMMMPIMVLLIAFFLVWYSKKSNVNGWLS